MATELCTIFPRELLVMKSHVLQEAGSQLGSWAGLLSPLLPTRPKTKASGVGRGWLAGQKGGVMCPVSSMSFCKAGQHSNCSNSEIQPSFRKVPALHTSLQKVQ